MKMDDGYVNDEELDMYTDGNYYRTNLFPEPSNPITTQKKSNNKHTERKSDFIIKSKPSYNNNNSNSVVLAKYVSHDVDPAELLEGYVSNANSAPIQIRSRTEDIVSYKIHHAAGVLVEASQDKEIRLSRDALDDLNDILKYQDEYSMTDPYVVLWDTLDTGSCRIYMKEVVNVSTLLLARQLGCMYTVKVTDDMESAPRSYKEVNVKPFHDSKVDYAQPFECEKTVREELERHGKGDPDEIIRSVKVHMLKLGVTPSEVACDDSFLIEQTETIGKLIAGELGSAIKKAKRD